MSSRALHTAAFLALLMPCLLRAQDSPHGPIKFACEDCHTPADWKTIPVPSKFKHERTGFPLSGQHATVQCMSCHTDLQFSSVGSNCADCHKDVHRGELGASCDRCHSPSSWLVSDMVDRHNRTRFALVAAHATAACVQCHPNAAKYQYVGVRTDCVGCHRPDFDRAANPNHKAAGFSTDCSECHQVNSTAWGQKFDHSTTAFPLTGAHRAAACVQCHPGNDFKKAATECYACHQAQFSAAKSPPHTGLPTECVGCHTTASWRPSSFDHAKTNFPLAGAHAAVACAQCHTKGVFAGLTTACYGCHQAQFAATKNPPHTGFNTACQTCHTLGGWSPASFDHSTTSFPLTGGHVTAACTQCHVNGVYKGTSTVCYTCHQADFTGAVSPSHAGYPTDCTTCHTTAAWKPSGFDHAKTAFPLTGLHVGVACTSCHVNGVYKGTATACYPCHQADFTGAKTPVHTGYPTNCLMCHSPAGWRPSSFDHSKTNFPLTGQHAAVACSGCHVNNVYTGTTTLCYGCHTADFTNAKNPPHTGFQTTCQTCHTTTGWQPASFDHSTTTFPLTGAHVTAACTQCHVNGVYKGTSTVCYTCHQADFTGAKTPSHTGYPTDCVPCHSTSAWHPSTFDHSKTLFPLTGAHLAAACTGCHLNGVYKGTSTDCYSCHTQDFTQAKNPPHAGFSTTCASCHTTAAWQPATFDHNTQTTFPLKGAHLVAPCAECHAGGVYKGLSTLCYSCHQSDFSGAKNPSHAGYPTECEKCHSTTVWRPASFDHNKSAFPLTGAHAAFPCAACHKNGAYASTPTNCYACHSGDLAWARFPSHTGYPTDCSQCHGTTSWHPSTFNHANTLFPLTGAHQAVACSQCHKNNVYKGTATDCYACHQTDFASAANPPHTGFQTTCASCHTTNAWQPATFDHNKTVFPLTGTHLTTTCTLCHVNNVWAGTPATCGASTCHLTDYNTTNPLHSSGGFGLDCQTCHTTTAWRPYTWSLASHSTWFPIAAGNRHSPTVWANSCATCHMTTSYKDFSCIDCHTHNKTTTDQQHAGRANYTYTSAGCYDCHPRGNT
jgi:hypothetical protein